MGSGGQFRRDVVIGESDGIESGGGPFGLLVVARAVAGFGIRRLAAIGVERPRGWHYKEIPEVAIPSDAAHLGDGEPLDGGMLEAVARAVVAAGDGVGTYLRHP